MKQRIELKNWQLKDCGENKPSCFEEYHTEFKTGEWLSLGAPVQVHEALFQLGKIGDRAWEAGDTTECGWISKRDWAYRCNFPTPQNPSAEVTLCLRGLDTVCDIFLNRKKLGTSRSMYLPFYREITGLLQRGCGEETAGQNSNELLLYFHCHAKMLHLYEETMPDEWKGHIHPAALLRKAADYGAPKEYSPIGIFADTYLELHEGPKITELWTQAGFSAQYTAAQVGLFASGQGTAPVCCEFSFVREGEEPVWISGAVSQTTEGWRAEAKMQLESPALWWPRFYGEQPLYCVRCRAFDGQGREDESIQLTGLREIKRLDGMQFTVNGKPVRLWGANFAPVWGPVSRYMPQKANLLLDRAQEAHFTALRAWGPGKPFGDDFYTQCDRRGLLVWQDLPTGGGELPDSPEYRKLFLEEAEALVRRLRHHPSILLWCGGNEHVYMCEYAETPSRIGLDLLFEGYARVCASLDPLRYYHPSCPSGGRYMNDPDYGDSHGSRAYRRYCAGEEYGKFFSENIRVFPPLEKSFRRFAGDEIWEEGYQDLRPFGEPKPMPKGWKKRLGNYGETKIGPIEDFYTASNVQELIYRYTAAAAQDVSEMALRARRGNPAYKSAEPRNCAGFFLWKMNDPWPQFYCALVDYYEECSLVYYALKRAFEPIKIDIEAADRLHLWGINDTGSPFSGSFQMSVYDILQNRIVASQSGILSLSPGESRIVSNLEEIGPFYRESVLYACLRDAEGQVVSRSHAYVAKENRIPFPPAAVSLHPLGEGRVEVSCDLFARCIELTGGERGDEFGWNFSDNYFDLLPGETCVIQVRPPHPNGILNAKAHYSPLRVQCRL